MRKNYPLILVSSLILGLSIIGSCLAQEESSNPVDIYSGYYSQEGNYGEVGKTTGHSHYIKFYPENRIARLYIPFPYSKTVKPDAINAAFNTAIKQSAGSAYIRDKFGVMEKLIVAHLDSFRWVDGQAMYDCSNAAPCKMEFGEDSMTVIKPGIVLEHEIMYSLIPAAGHVADTSIVVHDAWIREAPANAVSLAGYMVIENTSSLEQTLLSASAETFRHVMIHRTVYDNGMAGMKHQEAIAIPAKGEIKFEPNGYHLMLMSPVRGLVAGDQVPVSLTFSNGKRISVDFKVQKAHTGTK